MMALNIAAFTGRLAADPELRYTQSNTAVTSFRIAVDRNYCKQGEERQTDWIDCVGWRKTAEFISKYFHKGSMIAVDGSIQTRNYEDKNGVKRKAVELVVANVNFCGSKKDSAAPDGTAQNAQQPASSGSASAAPKSTHGNSTPTEKPKQDDFIELDENNDDLPF